MCVSYPNERCDDCGCPEMWLAFGMALHCGGPIVPPSYKPPTHKLCLSIPPTLALHSFLVNRTSHFYGYFTPFLPFFILLGGQSPL